jgi:competence protein ComEC
LKPVYFFIISFIFSVAIYSLEYLTFVFTITFGLLSIVFYGAHKFFKLKGAFLLFVIFLGVFLGGFRAGLEVVSLEDLYLDKYVGNEVVIVGTVIEEPDNRERTQRLTINIEQIEDEEITSGVKLITSVSRYPKYSYGDKLKLLGKLVKPENFSNENGRVFDYVNYLAKDNIFYTISFPEARYLGSGHGNFVKSVLYSVKHSWLSSTERIIPDPHVSLLGGLVVGAKQSLGSELEEDFRRTGIIHIVVLSGYNVTIVAEAIMRFFAFLSPTLGLSLGAISIIFFAIMTGASATIVRASIMALLVILARATGRTSEITHALFLAGFFMVLYNPMIVIFDPSFQLSFLATLGLIYLAPQIEKYFHLIPTKWQLREFATATIATQIFVLPLLLYMMGEISLVALPVNLLILVFIPITMLFGFLAGMTGLISSVLAFPFVAASFGLLSYELFVVDVFSTLSFASVSIPGFPLWLMLLMYLVYGFFLYFLYKNTPSA